MAVFTVDWKESIERQLEEIKQKNREQETEIMLVRDEIKKEVKDGIGEIKNSMLDFTNTTQLKMDNLIDKHTKLREKVAYYIGAGIGAIGIISLIASFIN